MMRVKVSFGTWVSMTAAGILAGVLALAAGFLLQQPVYSFMLSRTETGPGSVGTEALADTPAAASIADMERLDTFTMVAPERSVTPGYGESFKWEDGVFFTLDLPSGEKVAALINQDAVQLISPGEVEGYGEVQLPVGRWVEWDHSAEDERTYSYYEFYTDFTHYVDMSGDPGRMPTVSNAFGRVFVIVLLPCMILFYCLIKRYGVKRGWWGKG